MNAPIGLVVALESVSKFAASHPLVDLDWGPKGLLDGLNLRVSDTLDGIELAASHPLVDLDWGPKGLLDGLNLRVSDTLDGIELAASHPLVDLDWGPKGLLDGLNLRVSDTLDGIELAASHPLVDLDWGPKGLLDGLNLRVSDTLDGIELAASHPLVDLDWGPKGLLDGLNLRVSDTLDGIELAASHPLVDLDWGPKGLLDGLNLRVSDTLDGIELAASHPLVDLDWGPKGLLDGLNLRVSDTLDGIELAASHPLVDLDWGPLSAILNPAPVYPKRQQSVQMSREPKNTHSVCHHHDLLDSFDNQVTFTGLVRCTRTLFADGHYSLAVEKAFVYMENLVKQRSGLSGKYGSNLMKAVFSVHDPLISLNAGVTDSDKAEQLGYMEVFAGAMTGMRNPRAHSHNWIDGPKEALELLVIVNHLVRKILMANSSRNTR